MEERRKKPTIAFWATVVAVVLSPMALYVGAYLWLVDVRSFGYSTGDHIKWFTVAKYRWPWSDEEWESPFGHSVFAPLNRLDRKIRPEKWPGSAPY